ncbi:MAG: hypothetical protein WA774_02855, partial [Candidatus Acidiferrales bacterium]
VGLEATISNRKAPREIGAPFFMPTHGPRVAVKQALVPQLNTVTVSVRGKWRSEKRIEWRPQ